MSDTAASTSDDVRSWLRRQPEAVAAIPGMGAVEAARRIRGGEDWWLVVRELLDELYLWTEIDRPKVASLFQEEPPFTGDERVDALLGALAEHVAITHGFSVPQWARYPRRFLRRWWFPHRRRGFDALALRDAPVAFRRRGIMIHPSMLERR